MEEMYIDIHASISKCFHLLYAGADTQWMHATAQDSGAPSASDDDEEEEEEEEDAIEDDDEVLDIQGEVAEFPEPSQDADQWTDDEALLAHGPSINTGKVAWCVGSMGCGEMYPIVAHMCSTVSLPTYKLEQTCMVVNTQGRNSVDHHNRHIVI